MLPHPDDTIVALSSPAGPGGLRGVVRLSGPRVEEIVQGVFTAAGPASPSRRQFQLGTLNLTGLPALSADLYMMRAPNTFTGQDLAEFHTSSSPPLLERIISELLAAGARAAQPGEFTLRAFLAGKCDLPRA